MGNSAPGFTATCNSVTAYNVVDDLVHKTLVDVEDPERHNVLRRNGSEAVAAVQRASVGDENQLFTVKVDVDGFSVDRVIVKEKLVESKRSHR